MEINVEERPKKKLFDAVEVVFEQIMWDKWRSIPNNQERGEEKDKNYKYKRLTASIHKTIFSIELYDNIFIILEM